MTSRILSAVVAVTVSFSGVALAGQLLVPTSQTRTVAGSAFAQDINGSDSDNDSDQATDFGVFDVGASAQVTLDGALGSGGGTQDSAILPFAIVANGSAFANAESYDFDAFSDGSGSSRFNVTFTLTEEVDYVLSGSIAAFDDGFSFISLRDANVEYYFANAFGPAQEIPINQAGTLPAGDYTLEIEAEGSAFGDPFYFAFAFAEFMVNFQIAGLGPGGEVPDGKDVPGGPPLRLARLAGGDVALTWGPSCRGDDTDYGVYEGEIGDPASLLPLTCSTGGLRSYDAVPTHDASFFLVVPSDGATEGSYGNTSADLERAPGAVACHPQSLGEPVCP